MRLYLILCITVWVGSEMALSLSTHLFAVRSTKLPPLVSSRRNRQNRSQRRMSRFPHELPFESAIPDHVHLLILPGFGNDSNDYVLDAFPEGSLIQSLCKRGWHADRIHVLPLMRWEWLQVFAKGLLDIQFWQGNAAPTRPAYEWYLSRVAAHIRQLTSPIPVSVNDESNNDDNNDKSVSQDEAIHTPKQQQVVLLAHSAGGWLARAACGFGSRAAAAGIFKLSISNYAVSLDNVIGLVTLGAPHLPPPPPLMDMTRGALRITHDEFPGAYHDSMFYMTVAGAAVQGVKDSKYVLHDNKIEPTPAERYAYDSYRAVCGDGNQVGDLVVPLNSAHLMDAIQVTLPNAYHSINYPDRWYGSNTVIDSWHSTLLDLLTHHCQHQSQSDIRTTASLDKLN